MELKKLDIEDNPIKVLPTSLYKASSLSQIFTRNVPLKFPFNQYVKISGNLFEMTGITGEELARMMQFFSDISHGTEKFPQLKLVTLGHGFAGKVRYYLLK